MRMFLPVCVSYADGAVIPQSLENIAEAHLIVLTSGGVPEGQTLDYK